MLPYSVRPARVRFFKNFCPKQGIDCILCALKQGIDIINSVMFKRGYLFLDDKQPARMSYKLNYSNFFLYKIF